MVVNLHSIVKQVAELLQNQQDSGSGGLSRLEYDQVEPNDDEGGQSQEKQKLPRAIPRSLGHRHELQIGLPILYFKDRGGLRLAGAAGAPQRFSNFRRPGIAFLKSIALPVGQCLPPPIPRHHNHLVGPLVEVGADLVFCFTRDA